MGKRKYQPKHLRRAAEVLTEFANYLENHDGSGTKFERASGDTCGGGEHHPTCGSAGRKLLDSPVCSAYERVPARDEYFAELAYLDELFGDAGTPEEAGPRTTEEVRVTSPHPIGRITSPLYGSRVGDPDDWNCLTAGPERYYVGGPYVPGTVRFSRPAPPNGDYPF